MESPNINRVGIVKKPKFKFLGLVFKLFGTLIAIVGAILSLTIIGIGIGFILILLGLVLIYIGRSKQTIACPVCQNQTFVLHSHDHFKCRRCKNNILVDWM